MFLLLIVQLFIVALDDLGIMTSYSYLQKWKKKKWQHFVE